MTNFAGITKSYHGCRKQLAQEVHDAPLHEEADRNIGKGFRAEWIQEETFLFDRPQLKLCFIRVTE